MLLGRITSQIIAHISSQKLLSELVLHFDLRPRVRLDRHSVAGRGAGAGPQFRAQSSAGRGGRGGGGGLEFALEYHRHRGLGGGISGVFVLLGDRRMGARLCVEMRGGQLVERRARACGGLVA